MVVPSEKNAEIFDLVMDESDYNPGALQDSPTNTAEDKTVVSTQEVVGDVDNSGGDIVDNSGSVNDEIHAGLEDLVNENLGAINSISNSAIVNIKDNLGEHLKLVLESESFLSLSQSEDSLDGILEDSVSAGFEESKDISLEILASDRQPSANSINCKDETKSLDIVDSTLFENTQEPLELGCDESHDVSRDVFDVGDEMHKDTLGIKKEESPSIPFFPAHHSPPRLQLNHSPLLTSTPYSLPPMPRNRVSSTPSAPPSPLSSPYAPSPLPLNTTDGPMSLPTMSNSGSKSYDYLLKVQFKLNIKTHLISLP